MIGRDDKNGPQGDGINKDADDGNEKYAFRNDPERERREAKQKAKREAPKTARRRTLMRFPSEEKLKALPHPDRMWEGGLVRKTEVSVERLHAYLLLSASNL